MRINQIILESEYQEDLQSDLEDLLAGSIANNVTRIGLEKLAVKLIDMGYQVSPESLVPSLESSPLVQEVSGYIIMLTGSNAQGKNSDSSDKVHDMAKKRSMSSIKT